MQLELSMAFRWCRSLPMGARVLWIIILLALSPRVYGASLILIQGYQAKAEEWRDSGIVGLLMAAGWNDGGELDSSNQPLAHLPGPRFFTLDMDTNAPLMQQLEQLQVRLSRVREEYPGESLILAGHSAGGVLGRLYMVRQPEADVGALITFSSPHLGTEVAEFAIILGSSPLGWASNWLGEYDLLGRSQGLYFDLIRERPGSLLSTLR